MLAAAFTGSICDIRLGTWSYADMLSRSSASPSGGQSLSAPAGYNQPATAAAQLVEAFASFGWSRPALLDGLENGMAVIPVSDLLATGRNIWVDRNHVA
jgi:hypothetical protein